MEGLLPPHLWLAPRPKAKVKVYPQLFSTAVDCSYASNTAMLLTTKVFPTLAWTDPRPSIIGFSHIEARPTATHNLAMWIFYVLINMHTWTDIRLTVLECQKGESTT